MLSPPSKHPAPPGGVRHLTANKITVSLTMLVDGTKYQKGTARHCSSIERDLKSPLLLHKLSGPLAPLPTQRNAAEMKGRELSNLT